MGDTRSFRGTEEWWEVTEFLFLSRILKNETDITAMVQIKRENDERKKEG